jgi:hypothetical protein
MDGLKGAQEMLTSAPVTMDANWLSPLYFW